MDIQREHIERYLQEVYGTEAEHLWARYPEYAVFRHPISGKWYAIIMDVPKNKLGFAGEQPISILNVKCSPLMIGSLLQEKGFLPAYRMSKASWISICLDESVSDEKIRFLVEMSYDCVALKRKKKPRPEGD